VDDTEALAGSQGAPSEAGALLSAADSDRGGPPAASEGAPAPAEGGGSLSARTLALAATLVADAARRAAPEWDGAARAQAQGDALARRAVALGAINEEAYRAATAALAGDLPSASAEPRDHVLGDMLDRAAEAPLALARTAADVAVLGAHVAAHAPGQESADAIAAIAIVVGVARAATHLVAVNLATLDDDPRLYQARLEVRRAAAALPDGL
jgi:formiminotetrahydrofolate cyclodeaminase